MSTFTCPVIRIGKFGKNPNSDTLCIFNGPQGPLQFKEGELKEGDLACFVPADSLVPVSHPQFSFLADRANADGLARVRGIKLRGVPSVGLLFRCPDGIILGDGESRAYCRVTPGADLAGYYGITKYQPPQAHSFGTGSEAAAMPTGIIRTPTYDVENKWQFNGAVIEGTNLPALSYETDWSITEKIHGCNFRVCRGSDGAVNVGSRNRWVKDGDNVYWRGYMRHKEKLDALMANNPRAIFFGEIFGSVQDLHYGETNIDLRLFDMYDTEFNVYLPPTALYTELVKIPDAVFLYVPTFPVFHGTLDEVLTHAQPLASGKSLIDGKTLREGVVVRPMRDEVLVFGRDPMRLMSKIVSPEYLSRNNGTEFQ